MINRSIRPFRRKHSTISGRGPGRRPAVATRTACYGLALLCLSIATASAQVHVSSGGDLAAAVASAPAGSTISVDPGTYTLTSTLVINKPLVVVGTSGPSVTFINAPGQTFPILLSANNISLSGFTLSGGFWGIFAGDISNTTHYSNIQIRNMVVDTNPSAGSPGHGIYIHMLDSAVVESSTVVKAYANGIFVDGNSSNVLITRSTVSQTITQHAFAVKDSSGVILSGNTVTGSAADGILLIGSSSCRIEENNISGHQVDGITVTPDPGPPVVLSTSNYVARNTVVSNGLSQARPHGTGIWINGESDGTVVFGNTLSGSPENGISIFNASNNAVIANNAFGNGQGGIFVFGPTSLESPSSVGNNPSNNVVKGNRAHDNSANGNIQTRVSSANDISLNFVDGTNGGGGAVGILLQTTSSTNAIMNTVRNFSGGGAYIYGDTTSSQLGLNRFFNTPLKYSISPAGVVWDLGSATGGNYWSDFATANGNPSNGATPYSSFTGGTYTDHYPFQSETFGQAPAVAVYRPFAGQTLAAGTRKTIAWRAPACVFVDISYSQNGGSLVQIAANEPNTGYYEWDIPSNLTAGSGYRITVGCNSSAQASTGVNGQTGAFTIGSNQLVLRSPGASHRTNAGSAVRVYWSRPASGSMTVSVYLSIDGAAYQYMGSEGSNPYLDISIPNVATNHASILIQNASAASDADSVDGYFSIRQAAGVTTPATGMDVLARTPQLIEWTSPSNSELVDVGWYDPQTGITTTIVSRLPDMGFYTWVVPGVVRDGARAVVTFRTAGGTVITSAQSSPFQISASLLAPNAAANNSGFETGNISSWTAFGATPVIASSSTAYSGTYSLYIGPAGGGGGVYQDIEGLTPGQLYTISAHALGGSLAFLYVHDTRGHNVVSDGSRSTSPSSWIPFAVNFLADSTGKARVHLMNTGSGNLYWDDVAVTPGWISDFDGGILSPWQQFGGGAVSFSSSPAVGTFSLALTGSNGGVFRDFTGLKAGQWYTVTAHVRSIPGTSSAATILLHDTFGNSVGTDSRVASSSGWDTLEAHFLATSATRIRVHLIFNGGSGGVYFDDVRLISAWRAGFEIGLNGWNVISGASVTSTIAFEGNQSVVETGSGIYRDISGFTPGQAYHVFARARSSAGATVQALLWIHDSTGAHTALSPVRTPSSTQWEVFETTFVATSTGIMRLHILNNGGSGSLYWDDVEIETTGLTGFESGLLNDWTVAGGVTATPSTALPGSGAYSLALSGSSGLIYRDMNGLDANTAYRISFRARSSPGATGSLLLWVHDTANAHVVQFGPQTPSSSEWQTYTVNFLSTGTAAARIHIIYNGGAGAAYVDDVSIEKGWQTGFEDGAQGWGGFGGTTSSVTAAFTAYAGQFSLQQTGGSGGAYRDVTGLTPGQKYRISARVTTGSGSPTALLLVHDTAGNNAVQAGPQTPSSGDWDEFWAVFTADGTGAARIHLYDFGGAGTLYWDEVLVSPVIQ
jgi:parallel beta-helix repeat protein